MNVDVKYSPGDTLWAWVPEPVAFERNGTESIRYVPAKSAQANVRFVHITMSGLQTRIIYQIDIDGKFREVSGESVFSSEAEAEAERRALLSKPEYNWMKNES